MMSELPKSSMKSPGNAKSTPSTPPKIKRVTFKTPVKNAQSKIPKRASDQLTMAMEKMHDLMKSESRTQKLLRDVKGFYLKYHAQSLARYNLEKLLKQKMPGRHNTSLELAEEKQKSYFAMTAAFVK